MKTLFRLAISISLLSPITIFAGSQNTGRFHFTTSGHHMLNIGKPFFWLGDTAWMLFKRSPGDVRYYMKNRSDKGFTIVQIMGVRVHHKVPAETKGQPILNYDGQKPFTSMDPVELNEAYWRHLDFIIETARKHDLTIAMATMWGQDTEALFPNPMKNNYQYGKLLGERYKNRDNVIWLVTGEYEKINDNWLKDKQVISDEQRQKLRAVARGLEEGHGGKHLMTIHPVGTSSDDFHNDAWLDFNMHQTWGHQWPNVIRIRSDYQLTPVKPVLNGEPGYENRPEKPTSSAWKCRYEGYWSVFSGAFGYTYGAHHVWQCGGECKDALEYEGASDMQHLRYLMESRTIQSLVPDQSILLSEAGEMRKEPSYCAVLRSKDGRCALVYSTMGRAFDIDMSKMSGDTIKAWWYSPRDGSLYKEGKEQVHTPFATLEAKGAHTFKPPSAGQHQDWVLVLDDVKADFPPPGSR